MPNMKNAEKKILVDEKREDTNNMYVATMKNSIKKVDKAVAAKDKEKANEALKCAIKAIDNGIKSIADSEELEKGLNTAKERSLQLYEETIRKLNEIKDSEALKKGFEEIKQSSIQVKENINEFMNSEEVKQTIEKAKTGTINVTEKALDTLKSWLSPEGEDK